MFRSGFIGLVSGLALISTANAADMYVPGPAAGGLKDGYVPGVEWTGFYLGVGGGGVAVNQDLKGISEPSPGNLVELNGLGAMGGFGTVQVGYDRQFSPRFVAGVFADFDFDSANSKLGILNNTASVSFDLNNSWTVGGRLGYLVNPGTMAYVLAGYTQAQFDFPKGLGFNNDTFGGYSVGAGLETNITGNFFLKAEYRFTGLDTNTIWGPVTQFKVTDQPDIQTGRLVLSYKFNPLGGFEPLK